MQNQDIVEVKALIRQEVQGYALFSNKKRGDTPTDDTQLTPKKYVSSAIGRAVSSVWSSVLSGYAITGNLRVGGAMSVIGNITSGDFISLGAGVINGNASIAGNIFTGGNASIAGSLNVHGLATFANAPTSGGVAIPKTFFGVVGSSGNAGSPFPSGWTSSFLGTGNYSIIHNIGDTNYAAVATGTTFVAIIGARNNNDLRVNTLNPSGSLQNDSFHFIVEHP